MCHSTRRSRGAATLKDFLRGSAWCCSSPTYYASSSGEDASGGRVVVLWPM